ncbi:MAG TPA: tetratricopeptide repeat protein [Bryobacteraceae bacterium]|nr:tetratricopeptide repeat protein [Bryobacteraceae bacterium]
MPLPKNLLAITLMAAGGLTQAAFGQVKGGGAAPGSSRGGTSPIGSSPVGSTLPTTTPTTTTPTTTTAGQQPPIYVSGRVMLDDGTVPPLGVVIVRVCGAQEHAEGFTDTKGYFGVNIQFGQGGGQMAALEDASETGGYGTPGMHGPVTTSTGTTGTTGNSTGVAQSAGMTTDTRLMNCDLRAKLGGYRSQIVSLVDRRPMDNPDVGIILLHRLIGPEGGGTVSANLLAVPKDARKAFDKGQEAAKKQKIDEALKYYNKAVTLDPKFAMAWCQIGILQAGHGADEDAHKSFEEAVKADPKYLVPYLQLSLLEMSAHNWQGLADVTAQSLKLDSFSYPIEHFFNAIANFNLGNLGVAELEARQTEKLDTRHEFPKASQLLGVILAQRHDYLGAADELRNYLKAAPDSPEAPEVRAQLEQVEKLTDAGMPQVVK